jgi:hypothetical protein
MENNIKIEKARRFCEEVKKLARDYNLPFFLVTDGASSIDKRLAEENIRLKAEIEYLKKSQSLAQKLEELTTKEKVKVVSELKAEYELKVLLEITGIPLSVYYYNVKAIKDKINKYEDVELEINYLYLKKNLIKKF